MIPVTLILFGESESARDSGHLANRDFRGWKLGAERGVGRGGGGWCKSGLRDRKFTLGTHDTPHSGLNLGDKDVFYSLCVCACMCG